MQCHFWEPIALCVVAGICMAVGDSQRTLPPTLQLTGVPVSLLCLAAACKLAIQYRSPADPSLLDYMLVHVPQVSNPAIDPMVAQRMTASIAYACVFLVGAFSFAAPYGATHGVLSLFSPRTNADRTAARTRR